MSGKKEKSLLIFEAFIERSSNGSVNVKKLFSVECFDYWLQSRSNLPKNPPEAFRKALTSHCAGVDGRKPFDPDVEAALLIELRKKQVWECFKGTKSKVGLRGLQVKGYWEKELYAYDEPANTKKRKYYARSPSNTREKKRNFEAIKPEDFSYGDDFDVTTAAADLLLPVEMYFNNALFTNYMADPFDDLLPRVCVNTVDRSSE